ncbi:tetratricopeptide repeat protein [Lewinella sp. 4G2]|uniref:type IX secretion system periplasmic lipoprotein PorW/SprE n=1 Tax=Lewinella sp. 4G2 TaxID=1803372 RepID=UPI0007B4E1DF|nr:tetratricopeptide repeat protein [Lewinella sp. 4G2]OAV43147.1 hypothetical protein A3850_000950 [Lewinella sp. 4G2]
MVSKLTRFLFLAVLGAFVLTACASQKRKDEQSALGKLWHNMNSHYNGYFNARELMDESLLTLEEQHVDNYTQRLDMFPFLEVANPTIVGDDMDVAIEKVAIVVKKHPYSNWVDDSYLLVGQAQLIKQDYESAEKTLRFLTTEFRPRPKRKKAKRKKGKDGEEDEGDEDEFVSRREVDEDPNRARQNRIRARKEAQKERKKLQKEREKENKAKSKERERQRKARIKARKKGIKLAPIQRDTSANQGLENEPEEVPEEEQDLGPVGMISIFGGPNSESDKAEGYGEKSGSYVVKHRPAYQEGRLWLAWTLIKRDNFERAQVILEDLRADRGTYPDVRRKAMAVQAFNYLEQERLEEAIPFLEEAAEVAKDRNERARYYYIVGQLYQELQNPGPAVNAFEQAIAARPSYDLELGARLNLAQNSFLSGSGSAADAIAKLEKMAKEEKNLEYESQIYFSAATVALRDGNKALGSKYLRKALDSPSAGVNQRLESYNLLGDLAFDESDYLGAKLAYDTTLMSMPRSDERYVGVSGRRDQLAGVADNLTQIYERDSLLRIGTMPEAERTKFAQDLFQSQRAAIAAANTGPGPGSATAGRNNTIQTDSKFFAYNSANLKRSRRDFERRWGDRPLTDNWRVASRGGPSIDFGDGDANQSFAASNEPVMATQDEIDAMLKDVPVSEQDQTRVRLQLSENYFNLAREYREKLDDNEKALEAFGKLESQFPGSNFEAEAWYYQYLINTEMGRTGQAAEYAGKLKKKYYNSKFEKLANDPTYAAKLLNADNELNRTYEAALAAFEAGNYKQAHTQAKAGRDALTAKHPLRARYALLLAMTSGNVEGKEAYISNLQQVVAQFPGTDEEKRAKEILRLLGASGARRPGQATSAAGSRGFKESFKELHYVLILFDKSDTDLNKAKISVAEYNSKYHKLDRIRITNVYLGGENKLPVLILRRFKNGEEAMKFIEAAKSKEQEFLNAGKFSYDLYSVSQSNYREVLKQRSSEEYREWYKENY